MRSILVLLTTAALLPAVDHTYTLRQAVELALQQSPEVVMARLEEQKAAQNVRVAQDPFYPKLAGGTGAAYTSGYPLTIDGSPPSIFQARAIQTFYNRPKTYAVAEQRENARTATIDAQIKRDDVAYRTASLYLDVERVTQTAELVRKQVDEFQRVLQATAARVQEGRELPLESKKAEVNLMRAQQHSAALYADLDYYGHSLAVVLGFTPEDRIVVSPTERAAPELPTDEDEASEMALRNSRELQRMQSQLLAKQFVVKAEQAGRLPQVDLVAQYALLARYNFNSDFFGRFNRNAGQLGISVTFPLLSGTGAKAQSSAAMIEQERIREEMKNTRGRISLDARKSLNDLRNAEFAERVAKADLDAAREGLNVLLAQLDEGRVTMRDVAVGRTVENEKWIAFYEAQNMRERARLNVLRQTGSILAALR